MSAFRRLTGRAFPFMGFGRGASTPVSEDLNTYQPLPFTPSMNFTDPRNSAYLALIVGI